MGWSSCSRATTLTSTFFLLTTAAANVTHCGSLWAQSGNDTAKTETAAALVATHVDFVSSASTSLAREPMIVEHPSGALFVSGYYWAESPPETAPKESRRPQTVPNLWKSIDRGSTWTPVNVGTEADGAQGNSDVDLAIAPDGTLYFVSMTFGNKILEGQQITVGVSQDVGYSWHWTTLAKKSYDDRPWVAVTPDGAAHVIWNDGSGVYLSSTRDHGAHWSSPSTIHSAGGSSHMAAGPNGELAVRITPVSASGSGYDEGVDLVAVSTDGGTTWQKRSLPGHRDWAPGGTDGASPRWVEPLAWDSTGALYVLWTELNRVWLARSRDLGVHWDMWKIAETDALAYYPYLTARHSGELAATWFSGAANELHWQACMIRLPDQGEPQVTRSSLLTAESWRTSDALVKSPVRDAAGEYLAALFLRDGNLAVVSPIQNSAAKRFGFSFWKFNRSNPESPDKK